MANEIFVNSELLMEHIILSEGCSSCSLRCDSNLAGSKVPRMRNLLHFEIKRDWQKLGLLYLQVYELLILVVNCGNNLF